MESGSTPKPTAPTQSTTFIKDQNMEKKYQHYIDVHGEVLPTPCSTTTAATTSKQSGKNGSPRNRENLQYKKTPVSVLLSLFMRTNKKSNNPTPSPTAHNGNLFEKSKEVTNSDVTRMTICCHVDYYMKEICHNGFRVMYMQMSILCFQVFYSVL